MYHYTLKLMWFTYPSPLWDSVRPTYVARPVRDIHISVKPEYSSPFLPNLSANRNPMKPPISCKESKYIKFHWCLMTGTYVIDLVFKMFFFFSSISQFLGIRYFRWRISFQSQGNTYEFLTCTILMIMAAKFASMVEPAALNILEALALTMKNPVWWSKKEIS